MAQISIIVPVYKAERYLSACIDSILSQTFSDFQLILVDDGSPDGCAAICEGYAARDSRILFLRQENQGQSAARNHGLKYAEGQWICYVDSDDLIHPQMVELLYAQIQKGAGISMCGMLQSPELPGDFLGPVTPEFESLTMDEETLVRLFDKDNYPAWVACAKLIPREVIESYPFCPGRVYEDNEAVCRWVCRAGSLAMTETKLYFYRTNPISTTQSDFSIKKLDYLWALESILRFYQGMGWKEMGRRFTTLYVKAAADAYWMTQKDPAYGSASENIRKTAGKIFGRDRLPLTKEQFEVLLDAFHPLLVRLYWPLEGARRTVREAGVSGLIRKLKERKGKGE